MDYCIGNLTRLLVEKTARKCFSRILNDNSLLDVEIKSFHRRAAAEINNFVYNELNATIELSDYSTGRITIDKPELEKMSAEPFQFIKFKFESFISKQSNLARTEKIILNGKVLATDEFIGFFRKTYGTNKVVKPFDDFTELLSRGIVATAPNMEGQSTPQNEIEIKITVTTTPSTPVVINSVGPPVPPMPQYQRPPLPPIITTSSPIRIDGSTQSTTNIKINTPPLPPFVQKPEPDPNSNTVKKVSAPPLPPILTSQKGNIPSIVGKIVAAPPLPKPPYKPQAEKKSEGPPIIKKPNQPLITKKSKKK